MLPSWPRKNPRKPVSSRPRLEALEDRTLPAPVLDPGFGQGGLVMADYEMFRSERAERVVLQPDGKVVVAGITFNPDTAAANSTKLFLARFLADGSPDTAFGQGGRALLDRVGDRIPQTVAGLALLPDGSFAVAGTSVENTPNPPATSAIYVLHVSADGSADPTFYVTPVFNADRDQAGGLALQPDGKLVVAGTTTPAGHDHADLVAFRLDVSGRPDPSFGQGGQAELGGRDVLAAVDVALQPDGRLVILGQTAHQTSDTVLVRTKPDGSLDPAFDTDGRVDLDFDGHIDNPRDVLVQPDGRIIVLADAGLGSQAGALTGVAARFTADGRLDPTFHGDGRVHFQGLLFNPRGLLQPDGKLLLVGNNSFTPFSGFQDAVVLGRLNPDGSADVTFAPAGFVARPFGRDSVALDGRAADLALRPDGRIVSVGTVGPDATPLSGAISAAVAQFLPGVANPNERFLSQLYLDLLGRPVDPSGLASWGGLLDRGVSRFDVTRAIQVSTEYRQAVVREAYVRLMGRRADDSGLASWTEFLARGGTRDQLEASLVGSAEFFARFGSTNEGWLSVAYGFLLGRTPPDASGQRSWGAALAAGVPRAAVALALLGSAEGDANTVRRLYTQLLQRQADSSGLDNFTRALQQGVPDDVVVALLVASEEYFNRP
jgi:uncharacterized delta-60 repeat protein